MTALSPLGMHIRSVTAGYGRPMLSPLLGLFAAVASVIRWAEPWDIDFDDDPLLEPSSDSLLT